MGWQSIAVKPMSSITKQLPLAISLQDEATFANFYPGENGQIVDILRQFSQGQGDSVIYLCGHTGSGRSHLLQACCHLAEHYQLVAIYLPLGQLVDYSPQMLENMEVVDIVCIDDIESIAGNAEWEEALFHFYNRMQASQKFLLISAATAPDGLAIKLADLHSRLMASMIFQLVRLNESALTETLILRARIRGLTLSRDVAEYILRHYRRDMMSLCAVLEILDRESLAAKRKLTIPFVKEVLD